MKKTRIVMENNLKDVVEAYLDPSIKKLSKAKIDFGKWLPKQWVMLFKEGILKNKANE